MFSAFLKDFVEDNRGATAVEYGLVVSLIVIAMIAALQGVAEASIEKWNTVTDASNDAVNG